MASVGILYHAESEWLGNNVQFQKPARELMQHQIDFDVMSVELVCNETIENQQFDLNHEYFQALIIPYSGMTHTIYTYDEKGLQYLAPVFPSANFRLGLKKKKPT
ncbi:hypothetical protein JOC54_002852 [Alkalihalobacillus xiaoxiensis]|uniref:Uncharacterized protein n=1 Tax=Shouchella xiaoxiensis TaxID=766895 RepID=A0ABS2SVP3_9BACI|nr:hypothetical protein [Shouchella xiaoxiensis]MBM7839572.1 hypothetical protein [Shouchella xiaoxiensis]